MMNRKAILFNGLGLGRWNWRAICSVGIDWHMAKSRYKKFRDSFAFQFCVAIYCFQCPNQEDPRGVKVTLNFQWAHTPWENWSTSMILDRGCILEMHSCLGFATRRDAPNACLVFLPLHRSSKEEEGWNMTTDDFPELTDYGAGHQWTNRAISAN